MNGTGHNETAALRPLAELTAGLAEAPPEVRVSDVTLDSRAVTPGALFLACQGRAHHGLEFLPEALARGGKLIHRIEMRRSVAVKRGFGEERDGVAEVTDIIQVARVPDVKGFLVHGAG